MIADLSTYLVTDAALCGQRGVVRTVVEAVAGGVRVVQVREPSASGRELCELVGEVRRALAGTGVPVLVNDRLDVALAVGADGVHLGQSDLPVERARRVAGSALLIGLSVSTRDEVLAAEALPDSTVDYLGLGPVWTTPTKPEAAEPIGVAGVRELVAATSLPVVAIGGVHAHNAAELAGTGVRGVCVVSEICAAADPRAAAARMREVCC